MISKKKEGKIRDNYKVTIKSNSMLEAMREYGLITRLGYDGVIVGIRTHKFTFIFSTKEPNQDYQPYGNYTYCLLWYVLLNDG